jgi:tRNA threonylcarbamoyladenosine biosynthesis protein TsaB
VKVLAIDTALSGASVGVFDAVGGLIASAQSNEQYGQAEYLMPLIADVLAQAGVTYADLDKIAVTKGPGAFTGMRVGLAAAKAMGLSLEIPVAGVCTFEAMLGSYLAAAPNAKASHYGVLIETKREDYYFRMYTADAAVTEGEVLSGAAVAEILREYEDVVLIGDAVQRFCMQQDDTQTRCVEISLLSIGVVARIGHDSGADATAEPVYIRAPDASIPVSGQAVFQGRREK